MFKKAVRSQANIKIALTGPSGSGKTKGALMIAEGLGAKKVAVGDSENGSASLYAKDFEFDTVSITPPYTTKKYLDVIDAAIENKYDCLILDTISHAWIGSGGILDRKNQKDEQGGNSYANWNKFTPEQQAFLDRILNAPIDIIVTMRSKQDYVLEANDKGKMIPKKVGMAPQQREGVEYEFTTVFDLDMGHNATTTKDRTQIFDGKTGKLSKATGKAIREWLKGADTKAVAATVPDEKKLNEMSLDELYAECEKLVKKIDSEETKAVVMSNMLKAGEENDVEFMKQIHGRLVEITGG